MREKGVIMKKLFKVLVSVALVMSFAACGSSSSKRAYDSVASAEAYYYNDAPAAAYDEEGFYAEDYKSYDNGGSSAEFKEDKPLNDSARKLIKTYSINAETETFDDFVAATQARVNALQGYIQNMDSFNGSSYTGNRGSRYCNLTVRIPSGKLEDFVNFVGDTANITNKNLNVEDITLQYVDSESRKQTYEIEQERLLSLLEKCDNVEDMIAIESRLSEVRYHLESQASQLRTYDNLVDYATVYLNISEVTKYTPPEPEKYWDRVKRSFSEGIEDLVDGLKDFFVGFVCALPGLVLFAVIVVIVVLVIRAIVKSGAKKREAERNRLAEERMNQAKETAKKNAENGQ